MTEMISQKVELPANTYKSAIPDREDNLEYDIGNMAAWDQQPIENEEIKDKSLNEWLIEKARDGVQLLVNRLFSLPTSRKNNDVIAELPAPTLLIPREKTLPNKRPETKWERFAKLKGINKKKRDRMIWSEMHQEWRPRWGYMRADNKEDEWVLPAKPDDGIGSDPFEKNKIEKNEKIEKQKKRESANKKQALYANKPKIAGIGSLLSGGGKIERKRGGSDAPIIERSEKKQLLTSALKDATKSTASLGRFTPLLPNEKHLTAGQKRKFDPLLSSDPDKTEKKKNAKLADNILSKQSILDTNKAANMSIREEQTKNSKSKNSQ